MVGCLRAELSIARSSVYFHPCTPSAPSGLFSQQSPVIPYRLHLRPLMMFAERKPLWGFLGIQPRRVVSATQWKLHHFSKCSRISFAYCGDVVHRRGPTTMGTMVMPILPLALVFAYT